MKTTNIISSVLTGALVIGLAACSGVQRNPGRIYMPDMTYSRAYETYASTEDLSKEGVHFDHQPVPGTIARGEEMPFLIAKDAPGDSVGYVASKAVKDPLGPLDSADMAEAGRLFNINCAICHGSKLDGNGPLYKDGNGPFSAKPAQLVGGAQYTNMPEGQMFYSVTYGKNMMGSYASQLTRKQRWMVIQYIKSQQAAASGGGAKVDSTATAKK
ncbi:c-type cytochrome [Dinghuibacter silviterrae]|uniref:Cbb3-type cytochrome c oxidase subunit III n=1 Tax=Dinghuibacter silviterrae TaxID=1539049 RepID=A0A4R8DPK9_9BACT|nr:c-type cytochrome [Dinghuibacter silviterrae]TDW99647.1 cbb3-type cytochrome c oxidase subunit III [Dinghuibacter silviterrae]